MRTRMGTEKRIQRGPESGEYKGTHRCRATAVRHDTVMASCIDGPSHKWAIQSVTSHDPKITCHGTY